MADEHTSPNIASKASAVMLMSDDELVNLATKDPAPLRSIAASVLTQAPDREPHLRPDADAF